jgi:hypothetical protein
MMANDEVRASRFFLAIHVNFLAKPINKFNLLQKYGLNMDLSCRHKKAGQTVKLVTG